VKPLAAMFFHIGVGAILLAGLLVIELLLAGFIHLLALAPWAPAWLNDASEIVEQALFMFDLVVCALFLGAELIKLCKSFWKEIRNG